MKFHKVLEWSNKYGVKPFEELSVGTLHWYNWASKVGRRKYLKKSRMSTKKFVTNNPSNLNFRVFKSTVLKGKNVTPELLNDFKTLIETKGTVKYGVKYKYLSPKALYAKMKG